MAEVTHASLTGADLHEPKGVASASNNAIAQASGGAVSWDTEINPSKITLSTTVWKDKNISPLSVKLAGVSDPGLVKLTDDGSGSTGVFSFHFDPSTEEEVFISFEVPHDYKPGTDIKPHIHWCPTSTNTGNVVWGIEYFWSDIGDTIGNSTLLTATDAADGTSKKHQVVSFSAISGTTFVDSSNFICRVYRKAADASDTYTGDAALLSVGFHYEANKLGTDDEYPV